MTPELLRQSSVNMPGWQQAYLFPTHLFPLLEKALMKFGIMWFHNSIFDIPSRPTSTFHGQICLGQTWVPLPQFLQQVFPNL